MLYKETSRIIMELDEVTEELKENKKDMERNLIKNSMNINPNMFNTLFYFPNNVNNISTNEQSINLHHNGFHESVNILIRKNDIPRLDFKTFQQK